ncbi:MAG: lysine--tRNA ligase, partial [Methanosarcinales archaeon]|nr:lysine--tRNA ligase [Methanosarcinales archaeon]
SQAGGTSAKIPSKHMVTAVPIADHSFDYLLTVLERGGYDVSEPETIRERVDNVEIWLETFAPPMLKFKVNEQLPPEVRNFNEEQRHAMRLLAERMPDFEEGQAIHDGIYNTAKEIGMSPKKLFQTIYQAILGTKSGPRLGYFLVSLDRDFVVERFRAASE